MTQLLLLTKLPFKSFGIIWNKRISFTTPKPERNAVVVTPFSDYLDFLFDKLTILFVLESTVQGKNTLLKETLLKVISAFNHQSRVTFFVVIQFTLCQNQLRSENHIKQWVTKRCTSSGLEHWFLSTAVCCHLRATKAIQSDNEQTQVSQINFLFCQCFKLFGQRRGWSHYDVADSVLNGDWEGWLCVDSRKKLFSWASRQRTRPLLTCQMVRIEVQNLISSRTRHSSATTAGFGQSNKFLWKGLVKGLHSVLSCVFPVWWHESCV